MRNERLCKVLGFINPNDKLADVGCDHGYLAMMAIDKGVDFVQLIDNKNGPLASAKQNLKFYETKSKVVYSLSSGISNIEPCIDTVAICGMGGELISQIIDADYKKATEINKFILQPNSKVSFLRDYLFTHGFNIIDEEIVFDMGKVYEILVVKYEGENVNFNQKDVLFGPILKQNKDPLFIEKWENKLKLCKTILHNLSTEDEKYQVIQNEIKLIEEVLYES